ALEVAADLAPAHRAAAGELRASVAAATERLHEIIGVLREERPSDVRPTDETLAELVEGTRDAGMTVELRAPADLDLPPMVAHAAHRVVREALTNAARYAPGAAVTVTLAPAADTVDVRVVNAPPAGPPLPGPPAHGSGLLALRERVRLTGGVLDAGPRDGGFAVSARLPLTVDGPAGDDPPAVLPDVAVGWPAPDAAVGWPAPDTLAGRPIPGRPGTAPTDRSGESARRLRDARREVRRSLLIAFGAPVTLGLVLSLVYYPLATAGAVLDRPGYERLRVGDPRDGLGLPRRQAEPPDGDAADGCEYYTDGNFPFAEPTWRLCFADGRLASKERITR
ncbi:two-component sensor histidine kinase, partial [Micromonospora sicca]